MTQQPRIPDLETRQRNVARIREVCQQLDLVNLKLDEVLAMLEADNRRQRQERLNGKYRRSPEKILE
ncbi:MAG: hypothetical protein HC849_24910 [Oscillatoriales cyanobacterium RU_3_3]|nr:hypothetical protein [Microcoleus sp. SM1_3_4]NJM62702.1 hypothetical protein [Oscillatoriales cyanobacterium RU_3_3]